MGLPASCAAARLLRSTLSTPPLPEVHQRAQRCVHMGQAGRKVASWQAMNTISQGRLGPALSKAHVDCGEGLPALLLDSLSSSVPTSVPFSPQHPVLKIANSGQLGPHRPQTGCVVPTPTLLRQLLKHTPLSGSALPDIVGVHQTPLTDPLEPGQPYGSSPVVRWSLPPHQRSLSLHSKLGNF